MSGYVISVQAHMSVANVKPHSGGWNQNAVGVISVQANMSVANVKPRSGGRNQNYMPPEAKHAIEQAQKNKGMKP